MSDRVNNIGYIITESAEEVKEQKIIGEHGNKIVAEGFLQTELNKKNRNGRIYGTKWIPAEVNGPRITELKKTGNLKGENGHPSDPSISVQQTINPDKVCVKFLDVWMEGDNIKSRYCGTNTDRGNWFNDDLACGEFPSFSLRCLGSIAQRGGAVYVENGKIVTWDRVYYPSHEKAYTTKILSEATISPNGLIDNKLAYNKEAMTMTESGIITPITTDSMKNFIKHESANIRNIMNTFDTLLESMTITEDGQYAQLVGKNGELFVIRLESFVQNQIMDYCTKRV